MADALARLAHDPVGDGVLRRGGDPRLVRGREVLARAHDHVDAAVGRDAVERPRVATQGGRRLLDDRPPARGPEPAELGRDERVLREAVVVGVAAGVPARLGGSLRVPRSGVVGSIAVHRQERRRIHVEVLVEERQPQVVRGHRSTDGHRRAPVGHATGEPVT
jgi:hypothetical protein